MSITVQGSIFRSAGEVGDFAWMIGQAEYDDALFVFNDNEEQFRAFQSDPTGTFNAAGSNDWMSTFILHLSLTKSD